MAQTDCSTLALVVFVLVPAAEAVQKAVVEVVVPVEAVPVVCKLVASVVHLAVGNKQAVELAFALPGIAVLAVELPAEAVALVAVIESSSV